MPAIVRSNCIVWAVRRYAVLVRAWWAAGRRPGCDPVLRIRPSRLEPRKAPHFAVEHCDGSRWVREAVADILGLREPQIFDLRTLESVCARFGERVQ